LKYEILVCILTSQVATPEASNKEFTSLGYLVFEDFAVSSRILGSSPTYQRGQRDIALAQHKPCTVRLL